MLHLPSCLAHTHRIKTRLSLRSTSLMESLLERDMVAVVELWSDEKKCTARVGASRSLKAPRPPARPSLSVPLTAWVRGSVGPAQAKSTRSETSGTKRWSRRTDRCWSAPATSSPAQSSPPSSRHHSFLFTIAISSFLFLPLPSSSKPHHTRKGTGLAPTPCLLPFSTSTQSSNLIDIVSPDFIAHRNGSAVKHRAFSHPSPSSMLPAVCTKGRDVINTSSWPTACRGIHLDAMCSARSSFKIDAGLRLIKAASVHAETSLRPCMAIVALLAGILINSPSSSARD